MSLIWLGLLAAGGLAYATLVGLMILGLMRLEKHTGQSRQISNELSTTEELPEVSIVVAARNEETSLQSTLDSLLTQNYPSDKIEIIVVDDRSTDRTAEIVKKNALTRSNLYLVRQTKIDPYFSSKKQALAAGIAACRGEIILTTDADCRHHPVWARSLVERFTAQTGLVAGQARFDIGVKPPVWQRWQALDYQAQMVGAAGLITAGTPFNCSSASLAFRRAAYEAAGGYRGHQRLVSGDDELLMANIAEQGWKIVAAAGAQCIAATAPPPTLKDLWHQRTRWASKGVHYSFPRAALLSGVFLFYLMLTLTPIVIAIGLTCLPILILFGVKLVLDYKVLFLGRRLFGDAFRLADFIAAEFLHPPFIVLAAAAGHFGSFRWKGEHYTFGQSKLNVR
ncbi:MAG: glycosyltransferase [Calditrichaeota bacterium]|nr:glycosyltransferase [Calditrichota bacterium]